MIDRDAMQMALDAMVSFEGGTNGLYQGEFAEEITALRERLEQPEQEPLTHEQRCLIIASAIHGHVSTRGAIDWAIQNVERHHGIKEKP